MVLGTARTRNKAPRGGALVEAQSNLWLGRILLHARHCRFTEPADWFDKQHGGWKQEGGRELAQKYAPIPRHGMSVLERAEWWNGGNKAMFTQHTHTTHTHTHANTHAHMNALRDKHTIAKPNNAGATDLLRAGDSTGVVWSLSRSRNISNARWAPQALAGMRG